MRRVFTKPKLDVIKYAWLIYGFAIFILLFAIVSVAARGINWGTAFTGGTELKVKMTEAVDIGKIREQVGKHGYANSQIQETKNNTYKIRIPERDETEKAEKALEAGIAEQLPVSREPEITISSEDGKTVLTVRMSAPVDTSALSAVAAAAGYRDADVKDAGDLTYTVTVAGITDDGANALKSAIGSEEALPVSTRALIDVQEIGPGWGAKVTKQAVIAFLAFIIAVLVYLTMAFEFKMAVAAIVELIHDFLAILAIYAAFAVEVTPETVIAVLTVLSFSLYDTVVIFDRIKDNVTTLTRQSRKTYSDVVNDSVNETLVRSFNTSMTTLFPIAAILFLGGATLKAFALPLFIGIIEGTYSSIIFAPPLLAHMKEIEPKYKAFRERADRAAKATSRQEPEAPAEDEPARARPKPAAAKKPAAGAAASKAREQAGTGTQKKTTASGAKQSGQGAQKAKQGQKPPADARRKGPGSGKKKKKKR